MSDTWIPSPHFTKLEMQCRDFCGALPLPSFMRKLEALREIAAFPFIITSAARCAVYNASIGGAKDSAHVLLRAADILISGEKAFLLVKLAMNFGFTGIGVSQVGDAGKRFIHLDDLVADTTHPRPFLWSY